MSGPTTGSPAHAGASSRRSRVVAQTSFEARAILRNGEQLLVTVVVPVLALVGLVQADVLDVDTGGLSRIDFFTPGILALAVMTSSFTSQAIASAFDRRNGVLRLLSTTPLGRGGLLAGKVLGVLVVELVQVLVIGLTAVADTCRVVEVLINKFGRGRDVADGEGRLAHAFQSGCKCLHMRDFAAHQKLKSIDGAGIIREADKAFINDFGACFGGDIAAQIDIELACDLQVIRGPGVAHRARFDALLRGRGHHRVHGQQLPARAGERADA